jgi:hypothetical protein
MARGCVSGIPLTNRSSTSSVAVLPFQSATVTFWCNGQGRTVEKGQTLMKQPPSADEARLRGSRGLGAGEANVYRRG